MLASYAPLFGNVNGCQWHPNMIYFDNHRAMGSISYYVQQMYSQNRGDRLLPVSCRAAAVGKTRNRRSRSPARSASPPGAPQSEFKDLRVVVDGKTVYENNFADDRDIADWDSNSNSEWSVRDGALRQSSHSADCRIWLPGQKWSKYEVHAKARKIDGAEGFMVMVQVKDASEYVWVNFGGWGNTQHGVERAEGGAKLGSRQRRRHHRHRPLVRRADPSRRHEGGWQPRRQENCRSRPLQVERAARIRRLRFGRDRRRDGRRAGDAS